MEGLSAVYIEHVYTDDCTTHRSGTWTVKGHDIAMGRLPWENDSWYECLKARRKWFLSCGI